MQYNKNEIQKTNDKKILRKVKKQWVVVSLASFAFLGGTSLALMSHGVSAHADDTTKNNTEVVQPNNNRQSSNQQSDDNKQTASNNDQQNQNDAKKILDFVQMLLLINYKFNDDLEKDSE